MVLLTIQPGDRAKAHKHDGHETAIYVISGRSVMWYGDRLEKRMVVGEGDMLYIPAGVPHLPANVSDKPCVAVIARTDPNEQESVVLLPELEALVPGQEAGAMELRLNMHARSMHGAPAHVSRDRGGVAISVVFGT